MVLEKLKEYKETLHILQKYEHALALISFDLETVAPHDAKEEQGDLYSYFSNEKFKLENSDRMKELVIYLHEHKDELSYLDAIMIEKKYDEYLKSKNITPEFEYKMSKIYMKSELDWEEAKNKNDFSIFKDSLESVINIQKEAINLRENKLPNMYDNMLDDCEKGVLSDTLDKFFKELKEGLLELLSSDV